MFDQRLQKRILRLVFCTLLMMIGLAAFGPASLFAQTQVHTNTQNTSISDSFYEYNGVNWGYSFGNPNGSGNRSYGGFSFGAPAIPAFGGYSPNSAGRFGFATLGRNSSFNFGLEMGYGSNRTHVSNGVSTTSINGIPSSIFSGFNQPFVTGVIPVLGQGFYPYPGGYSNPYPYAYQVNVSRRDGRTTSQMIRDSGHVGAHDHGHRHSGTWQYGRNWQNGGYHYDIYPIYGPPCAVPYRNGYGYGFGNYGYGNYGYAPPYNYSLLPNVGAFGPMAYSDGYGTFAATPIPGTLAAGMTETQAAAARYWADQSHSENISTTGHQSSDTTVDPLGNPVSTGESKSAERFSNANEKSTMESTATQRPESLLQIRKRLADQERIETELRHAAINRILDQARSAYEKSDYDLALQLSETALQRCEDSDSQLKEKIERGINRMRAKK